MRDKREMRDKRITVRLTQEQYDEIERRRKDTAKSEYLYLVVLEHLREEREIDKHLKMIREESMKMNEFCKKIHSELGRIGNNINQIARHLNARRKTATRKEREVFLNLAIETIELIQELKLQLAEWRENGNPEKD